MKLRPLEPEDLDFMYTIENDAELWDTTDSDAPYSRHALRRYLAAIESVYESGELRLVIEIDGKDGPVPIGTVQLSSYTPLHARAEVGLALLKSYRGQGYGTRAVKLVESLAVKRLHVHSLHAVIARENEVSLAIFTRLGYHVVGTLPDWLYQGGRPTDALLFVKVFSKKPAEGLVD